MLQRTASHTTASPARGRAGQVDDRRAEPSRLFPTKNDLPETTRSRVVELLNQRLADCIDLQTQCKQAHWNVKGPSFIGLHKLFDDINEDVEGYVDLLAERAVQLGGVAEGTARSVAARSTLSDYPAAADQRGGARKRSVVRSGHFRSRNPAGNPTGGRAAGR